MSCLLTVSRLHAFIPNYSYALQVDLGICIAHAMHSSKDITRPFDCFRALFRQGRAPQTAGSEISIEMMPDVAKQRGRQLVLDQLARVGFNIVSDTARGSPPPGWELDCMLLNGVIGRSLNLHNIQADALQDDVGVVHYCNFADTQPPVPCGRRDVRNQAVLMFSMFTGIDYHIYLAVRVAPVRLFASTILATPLTMMCAPLKTTMLTQYLTLTSELHAPIFP